MQLIIETQDEKVIQMILEMIRPFDGTFHEIKPSLPNKIQAKRKKTQTHDLSLVVMANQILKGSEPLSEIGEIAFERAFSKSLKTVPTLPNRL
jgi:hypothetical protein